MIRLFLITALILVLNGCATPIVPVTEQSYQRWNQRQQQLATLNNWDIHGRVALFINDDVYNLGLNWSIHENQSSMKLEAALGQGMINLEQNNAMVSLTTSTGETYYGANAEEVLRQSTGWSIPVEGLKSWIKGINHDQSEYLPEIDGTGRARSLTQDEWKINYLAYESSSPEAQTSLELPKKIYMKRQNLRLKIVIDQWQAQQNITPSVIFPDFKD